MIIENLNLLDCNAALYIRLSKDDGKNKESESVKNQRDMLRSFASKNNIKVYKEYIDDGFSGTTFNRPSFNVLIKDIENKKVNMVITKDLSRLKCPPLIRQNKGLIKGVNFIPSGEKCIYQN